MNAISDIFGKTRTPKAFSSHLLVAMQFVFVCFCCYPQGWWNAGPVWFLVLCLGGAILGIVVLYYNRPRNFSVYPEIRVDAELITQGPYRFVRHPMYSALMLMMIGITGYNGHWINYIALTGLICVVTAKAAREEKLLSYAFPGYVDHVSSLKRFIPGVY